MARRVPDRGRVGGPTLRRARSGARFAWLGRDRIGDTRVDRCRQDRRVAHEARTECDGNDAPGAGPMESTNSSAIAGYWHRDGLVETVLTGARTGAGKIRAG